ncbi:hypothetical protein ACFQ1S_07960 [Kibdelosporangium lantanae]|uniref:Secreted protein n=1 Tax=Kibdelosporangium lantanae TaxID=1497396 RepID=A0ABW3M869_9PSEU
MSVMGSTTTSRRTFLSLALGLPAGGEPVVEQLAVLPTEEVVGIGDVPVE